MNLVHPEEKRIPFSLLLNFCSANGILRFESQLVIYSESRSSIPPTPHPPPPLLQYENYEKLINVEVFACGNFHSPHPHQPEGSLGRMNVRKIPNEVARNFLPVEFFSRALLLLTHANATNHQLPPALCTLPRLPAPEKIINSI